MTIARRIFASMLLAAALAAGPAHASAQATFQLSPGGAAKAAPERFLDTWGTPEQCAAHRAGRDDDMRLHPYDVSDQWIRQGFIYCFTTWVDHRSDGDRAWARAIAACGEDTLRTYELNLTLDDDRLRIRWSEDFTTRLLERCG